MYERSEEYSFFEAEASLVEPTIEGAVVPVASMLVGGDGCHKDAGILAYLSFGRRMLGG